MRIVIGPSATVSEPSCMSLPLDESRGRRSAMAVVLTGSGKAGKDQVQHAIRNELHLKDLLEPNDVADAAAVALCHYYMSRVALPAQ